MKLTFWGATSAARGDIARLLKSTVRTRRASSTISSRPFPVAARASMEPSVETTAESGGSQAETCASVQLAVRDDEVSRALRRMPSGGTIAGVACPYPDTSADGPPRSDPPAYEATAK